MCMVAVVQVLYGANLYIANQISKLAQASIQYSRPGPPFWEPQVMCMVGVEPVADALGRVNKLRVIPLEELGRPRVDVVVNCSGVFRDLFVNQVGFSIVLPCVPQAVLYAFMLTPCPSAVDLLFPGASAASSQSRGVTGANASVMRPHDFLRMRDWSAFSPCVFDIQPPC